MYIGLGVLSLTKDKAEEIGKELVKKGELSEKEGKQFANEIFKKSEKAKKELKETIIESVHRANVVTKKDLEKLEKEIKKLLSSKKKR